jgi:hypothetical protein
MVTLFLTLHVVEAITIVINFALAVHGCISRLRNNNKGIKPPAFRNRRR